jgi:tetratricopeptide (TPR) repeat protein
LTQSYVPLTPHTTAAFKKIQDGFITMINPLVSNREVKAAQLYGQACEIHPECSFYFMQAQNYSSVAQWAEAERTALLAAQTPAMNPNFTREAFFLAAFAQAAQAVEGKTEKLPLAVANIRKRLALGPLKAQHAYYMWKIAKRAEDWPLARELSDNLLSRGPGQVERLEERARMELQAGAFQSAIEFADRALEISPDLESAREARQQAVEKLQAWIAQTPPTK